MAILTTTYITAMLGGATTGAAQATQANAMAAGITKALIDAGFAPQQKATK